MDFRLYVTSLSVGGVPTQIVRLANVLHSRGHRVSVHLKQQGAYDHLINPEINRVYSKSTEAVRSFGMTDTPPATDVRSAAVTAFAPDPESLMFAVRDIQHIRSPYRVLLGVYHPRCFQYSDRKRVYHHIRNRWVKKYLPVNAVVFMNEAVRNSVAGSFDHRYLTSPICPIILTDPGIRTINPDPMLIVSVGRLARDKTYNLYMLEVIRTLRQRGFPDVRWNVYGEGDLSSVMREKIIAYNLQNTVQMKGNVPYERFCEAVGRAKVFVGMGTSLIEAGLYGVPGVIAVDRGGTKTYGTTSCLRGFNVGEFEGREPDLETVDLLEQLLSMSDTQYAAEVIKCRKHCERFLPENVVETFIGVSEDLQLTRYSGLCHRFPAIAHDALVFLRRRGYQMKRRIRGHLKSIVTGR